MDQTQLPVYLALAQASWYNDKPKEAQKHIETYLIYEDNDPQAWLISAYLPSKTATVRQPSKPWTKPWSWMIVCRMLTSTEVCYILNMGEGQKAVNDLVEAVRFKPNDFEINLELGRALLVAERYMDAYKQLNSTQKLAETDAQLAEVFYWRGQTLEAGSNPNAAEVDYLALLALPSERVPAKYIAFAKERLIAIKSPTPTASATSTKTLTPTATPTRTLTPTLHPHGNADPQRPLATATASLTIVPSKTSPASKTPTPSRTPTKAVARTATRTATRTPKRKSFVRPAHQVLPAGTQSGYNP